MSGIISKLMPSRDQHKDIKVIADLDQILSETVGFRFKGKTYELRPVDTETFMRLADVLGEIQTLIKGQSDGKETSTEQVYKAYHDYISVLCPKITIDILKSMEIPQVHALLNLVIKHATGQPMNMDDTSEKKKLN